MPHFTSIPAIWRRDFGRDVDHMHIAFAVCDCQSHRVRTSAARINECAVFLAVLEWPFKHSRVNTAVTIS
jgi:hypothetical protein